MNTEDFENAQMVGPLQSPLVSDHLKSRENLFLFFSYTLLQNELLIYRFLKSLVLQHNVDACLKLRNCRIALCHVL